MRDGLNLPTGRTATIVRWVALVPATVIGWFAVFFTMLFVLGKVERMVCPPEFLSAAGCYAAWWSDFMRIGAALGAGVSAAVVVMLSACIAPSRKIAVTRATFYVGTLLALFIAFTASLHLEATAALLSGALMAQIIERRLRKLTPD